MVFSHRHQTIARIIMVAMLSLSVAACAHRPPDSEPRAQAEYDRVNDPLEPLNRTTHSFNMFMDAILFKPIAQVYRAVLPKPIRKGITNALNNLAAPLIFANDLLQGKPDRAHTTLSRFLINTTVGIGGVMDPATDYGFERHNEDFGETLAVWGMGEGFYLVLPFLGPSNPRDLAGFTAEFFGDPTSIALREEGQTEIRYARTGLEVIDFRERNLDTLDELERNSSDLYAAMRSAYRQNRVYRITDGKGSDSSDDEDDPFDMEMDADF